MEDVHIFDTNEMWRKLGDENPYQAVLTYFMDEKLSESDLRLFFSSGEKSIQCLLENLAEHFRNELTLKTALDFGCGVGRLTIPLARRFHSVTGVDISIKMLEEAHRNAKRFGVDNVDFLLTDEFLLQKSYFDLVLSYICLQHIPFGEGKKIVELLLDSVCQGGYIFLHVVYDVDDDFAGTYVKADGELLLGNVPNNPVAAYMLMCEYDLKFILNLVRNRGYTRVRLELTDHEGYKGCVVIARKKMEQNSIHGKCTSVLNNVFD